MTSRPRPSRPAPRRPSGRGRAPRPGGVRIARIVVPVVVVAVAAFLYARPISNYNQTKADLAARETAVQALRKEKRELTHQLARTTDLDALARQARRIGYVRPGEQLFIVKGIPAFRRSLAR